MVDAIIPKRDAKNVPTTLGVAAALYQVVMVEPVAQLKCQYLIGVKLFILRAVTVSKFVEFKRKLVNTFPYSVPYFLVRAVLTHGLSALFAFS